MRYKLVKNPKSIPPKTRPFNFPNLSIAKGNIGLSMTWMSGVSRRSASLANSKFLTNSVRIAVLACTSTWRCCEGARNTCMVGFRLGLASLAKATPLMAAFKRWRALSQRALIGQRLLMRRWQQWLLLRGALFWVRCSWQSPELRLLL